MTGMTDNKAMSEEQMVHLVRNALLVAGQEMGDGDQWPVIKDTVYKVMKDWEDQKIERNVDAELSKHYGDIITYIESNLDLCPAQHRAQAEQTIRNLRELHQARFDEVREYDLSEENLPVHIQRMINIVKTLGDENA